MSGWTENYIGANFIIIPQSIGSKLGEILFPKGVFGNIGK